MSSIPYATGGKPMNRCSWARDELSIRYHDEEWGVPVHDDQRCFEFLVLEGAQAGLSWDTILRKARITGGPSPILIPLSLRVSPIRGSRSCLPIPALSATASR